jgi:hypothetical protein
MISIFLNSVEQLSLMKVEYSVLVVDIKIMCVVTG